MSFDIWGGVTTAPGTLNITDRFGSDNSPYTFNHNNGTINFLATNGYTNIQLYDAMTVYNLSMVESTNDSTDKSINFLAGYEPLTVAGTLTLNGLDSDDIIEISGGSFNVTGSFGTIDFVGVTDNTLYQDGVIKSPALNPTGGVNGGNAMGWFTSISGTIYDMDGVTLDPNNYTVRLLVNGVDSGLTGTANDSGEYAIFSPVYAAGAILTLYIDNGVADGVTVVKAGSSANAGIATADIYEDTLIIRNENTGSVTNANLDTANNGDSDITAVYADSGGAAITTATGKSLLVYTGDSYVTGGAVVAGGNIRVMATATMNPAANNVTVAGNIDNDGTWTHTGNLIFNGTAQTYNPGSATIGSDITLFPNSITTIVDNHLNIGANTITINTDSVLYLGGKNLTSSGTFANEGTLRLIGSETITSLVQDTNSGTWEYIGDSDAAVDTFTIKDFGAGTDYYNLYINDANIGNATEIFDSASALTVANDLTVDGLLTSLGTTMDVNGDVLSVDGMGYTSLAMLWRTIARLPRIFTHGSSAKNNPGPW